MPAVDASAGLGYEQEMCCLCRDVCNVCRGREAGCVCRAPRPRVPVHTGDPRHARHACVGLCEPQVGATWCARGVRARDTRGVQGPYHMPGAVPVGVPCWHVPVGMGSSLPLNMGLTLQTPRQPWLANCPKESSMKKRGMPQNTSMMK